MLDILNPLARDAGALALSHFGNLSAASVDAKGPLDLVTVADRAVEAMIVDRLRATFPDDGILGEEGGMIPSKSGRVWVIDPIDGTFNFVRGGRQWTVSIGLWQDGRPVFGIVHAPVAELTILGGEAVPPTLNGVLLHPLSSFDPARASVGVGIGGGFFPTAERISLMSHLMTRTRTMVRVCNSATWSMIEVATGEADAYLGYGESSWDVAGLWPILKALGAVSTADEVGLSLDEKLRFVIGKPEAVDACRHALTAAVAGGRLGSP